jgi:hypothetical protein
MTAGRVFLVLTSIVPCVHADGTEGAPVRDDHAEKASPQGRSSGGARAKEVGF